MQLVRLGYIVPALDGFEEVFLENAGDAVSTLGSLIQDIRGEGTLLIAARKAYFDFRRLDRQAKLLDAIPDSDVGFGRLGLRRWGRDEFESYCRLNSIVSPDRLYDKLATILHETDHPFLTRPVFVRRIVDLAKSDEGFGFLENIGHDIQELFVPFIDRILDREITEKWIDKLAEPATPLLSLPEHHSLLGLLAEEMWVSKRGTLTFEMCESLADIYCDTEKKSPATSRQVRERLLSHALLVSDSTNRSIAFDHDHFREFFLGEQIGIYLARDSQSDLRNLLRTDSLSTWTLDTAEASALRKQPDATRLLDTILAVSKSEGPSSYVRENAGALSLRFAQKLGPKESIINDVTFPPDSLTGRKLARLRFEKCYFRSTKIDTFILQTSFARCDFEHIDLANEVKFESVNFADCNFHGLTIERDGEFVEFYDPDIIESCLAKVGATFSRHEQAILATATIPEDDEDIKLVRKLLAIFRRNTQVSDSVLAIKMGIHYSRFVNELLPGLLSSGVLAEVPNRGGGNQRRFRMARTMSIVAASLAIARGSYREFLIQVQHSRA